ncbi:MAG: sugar phosphate isomerase/epimerase family protein, partial [Candidatus Dormibacteraceae bacterium]
MSQIGRRSFLRSSAIGLAALGAVGAQWTESLFGDPLGLPIGLQLYTVRQACEKNLPATLKRVADTGYREVELGSFNYYGRKPGDLRRLLADYGLPCTSASYGTDMMKSGWEKHIEEAHELGTAYMVCASIDPKEHSSLAAIHQVADLFNRCAEQCRKAGVAFAYHCHNFDFRDVEGTVAYDELLRHTDPKLVDMEMDCFWTTMAGKDPVAYFHRYPGRFALLHIKDLKPGFGPTTGSVKGGNPFTEVGRGVIKWKRIFEAARVGGLKHY